MLVGSYIIHNSQTIFKPNLDRELTNWTVIRPYFTNLGKATSLTDQEIEDAFGEDYKNNVIKLEQKS